MMMDWEYFLMDVREIADSDLSFTEQADKILHKATQYRCSLRLCEKAKADKSTVNRWKREGLPMAFDTMQDILHVMGLELKIVRKRHV